MKFLFDIFPVLLFFLVYQVYGHLPPDATTMLESLLPGASEAPGKTGAIYLATASAIAASFVQVGLYWLRHHRFHKMHLVSLVLITLFGGATLVLRDPTFIKWKPTILEWVFATAFLASGSFGNKTLVERMLGHAIDVPGDVWRRVNFAWVAFFVVAGLANLYVAYGYSESTWVNFKMFGMTGITFLFTFASAVYLARHMAGQETSAG
ncbi:MAG: septation protein A [Pseudomonadota bacterium]|nr:septation protein A [Pseudomonadota bacterium]